MQNLKVKKLQVVDLNLLNAKIPIMGSFVETGISIEANRIYKLAKSANMPRASKTIDIKGNVALPGLIDIHVHLRGLDLSYKEDYFTGTCAAAAGGFTTVIDMPNTKPSTNTPHRLKEKIQRAKSQIMVNVGFYAAFPKLYKHFNEMVKNGALAFKVFLHNPVTELNVNDDETLLKALNCAKRLNRLVAVHAEDGEAIKNVEDTFRKSGKTASAHYLQAHSIEREVNAVKRIVNLAGRTDSRIHFCHVSTAQSINIFESFKKITCEVTPHHLFLTSEALRTLGGKALMNPPLRSTINQSKLWMALNEGLIDVIASDHAPHLLEEKKRENIWEVPPGIPGLETTLPLLLNQVNKGRMSLNRLIQLLSTKPANILNLNRGSISTGSIADIVVVAMDQEYTIDSSQFYSKAKYSPFDGWKVKGKPIKTFVGGRLVYDSGEIMTQLKSGKILHP